MVLGDHFEASPGASASLGHSWLPLQPHLLLLSGQSQRPGLSCPLSLQPICSLWTLTVPCPLPAAGQKSCACFPLHTPEFFPPQRHTEQPTCAWALAFLSPSQGGEACADGGDHMLGIAAAASGPTGLRLTFLSFSTVH